MKPRPLCNATLLLALCAAFFFSQAHAGEEDDGVSLKLDWSKNTRYTCEIAEDYITATTYETDNVEENSREKRDLVLDVNVSEVDKESAVKAVVVYKQDKIAETYWAGGEERPDAAMEDSAFAGAEIEFTRGKDESPDPNNLDQTTTGGILRFNKITCWQDMLRPGKPVNVGDTWTLKDYKPLYDFATNDRELAARLHQFSQKEAKDGDTRLGDVKLGGKLKSAKGDKATVEITGALKYTQENKNGGNPASYTIETEFVMEVVLDTVKHRPVSATRKAKTKHKNESDDDKWSWVSEETISLKFNFTDKN